MDARLVKWYLPRDAAASAAASAAVAAAATAGAWQEINNGTLCHTKNGRRTARQTLQGEGQRGGVSQRSQRDSSLGR